MPYIEVSHLSKSFQTQRGPVSVLRDLEFAVETGEMVAIVGASGVGKSTLLQLLGGLDSSDSGSIVVGGVDIASLSDGERINFRHSQVGFVFQFHHLLPEFTALENTEMPLRIARINPEQGRPRAKALLVRVGPVSYTHLTLPTNREV